MLCIIFFPLATGEIVLPLDQFFFVYFPEKIKLLFQPFHLLFASTS